MRTSAQILGLPIISISEGLEIGSVKSLVINPEKGSVDFLTIEHEDWQVSVKAIPFKKVIGIGEYAVTVESESAVIDLNEIPIANQLVNKKIKITDSRVMTRKGELLGTVSEFFTDEENGHIMGMQIKLKDKEVILRSDSVLTFGRDILIVTEEAPVNYLETPDELQFSGAGSAEDIFDENAEIRNKQIELLKGKRLRSNVEDPGGNVLFTEGSVLSEADIKRAQEAGPGVLVGLSMNVEA